LTRTTHSLCAFGDQLTAASARGTRFLEYHLPPAKDLKMIKRKDHAELSRAPGRAETNADRTSEAER
jgi:hypothetical protein